MLNVKGYLLDNNSLSRWHAKDAKIIERLRSLPPETPLRTSSIVMGEIFASHETWPGGDSEERDKYERFLNRLFRNHTLSIGWKTRWSYSLLIKGIHASNLKPHGQRIQQWLSAIGVDLHDVWIAAQAIEHNLILVTNDKMEKIREAGESLLDVEDWSP